MTASRSAVKLAWAVPLWLGLAGCGDSTSPGQIPVSAALVTVNADSGSIFRTLTIQLSDPAPVQVDYWIPGAPRLRVVDSSSTALHSVFLPGLRAEAAYHYEVRVPGPGLPHTPIYHGELVTDPLPEDLAAVGFAVTGRPAHRLTMLELRGVRFSGHVMLDQDGNVVWFRRGPAEGFTRRANGDLVLLTAAAALTEVRPDLTVVAQLPATPDMSMHHDVITTPANTLLFLTKDAITVDGVTWVGDAVWEWSPEAGTAIKRWTAHDFLSPTTDQGPKSVTNDWLHANSLSLGPRGNLLVSLPAINQIVSIAPGFQHLEWRLGGPNATIVPDDASTFWFEHNAQEIAPNRVLMFDNGRDRPGDLFSRALELELDPAEGTARTVGGFRPAPDIYSPIVGSARRLPNGTTVVDFGTRTDILGASGPMSAYDVAPDGTITWSLRITGGDILVNYRATPLDDVGGELVVPPLH